MFKTQPKSIICVFKKNQDLYSKLKKYNLIQEFVNIDKKGIDYVNDVIEEYSQINSDNERGTFVLLDDLMTDISSEFENMFCVTGHHKFVSFFLTCQKLHYDNDSFRTISSNADYTFIMKSPRNSSIQHFAKQISPHDTELPIYAYNKATKNRVKIK